MQGLLIYVCALVLVDTIFFSALTPLLPYYVRVAHLSKATVGILVASYPLGTLVGASRWPAHGAAELEKSGADWPEPHERSNASLRLRICRRGPRRRWLRPGPRRSLYLGGKPELVEYESLEKDRRTVLGTAVGAAVGGVLLGPVVGALADEVGTGLAFIIAAVARGHAHGGGVSSPAPG